MWLVACLLGYFELTYNQAECDHIPRCIDDVHLPSDISQPNGHEKGEEEPRNRWPLTI